MEVLTQRLLNDYQREFPLEPQPFDHIARELDTCTATLLDHLRDLQVQGVVSRVGPVFRPNTIGASTLAAMAVPAAQLERVAALVNGFPQVNHNYEREHRFNLWFVLTAPNQEAIAATLEAIRQQSGLDVMSLPLVRDYHIDLGFHLRFDRASNMTVGPDCTQAVTPPVAATSPAGSAEDLIEAIQGGLPLVSRPYQAIAERIGCTESGVIEQLRNLLERGIIKRLGVVVRHHELGYRANAMVVWDVADDQVDRIGRQLGDQDCVTLCYQRPRRLPGWRYNLFCMVHGQDRDEVLACIERMTTALGLGETPHEILFSGRRFRQRGAHYRIAG
ncbi:MAG TPA: Lrp/AsnC family transcriptional regulator [Gammaproteobacteria bacterium]|nr:Lrp/AsnC family transcriptional regulator [Gammaproteobacteria bacterium]